MRKLKITSLLLLALFIAIVGCDRDVTERIYVNQTDDSECFTCHGDDGFLTQAQGEWANSIHAAGAYVDYTNREGRCTECHSHQGFLEFLETGESSPTAFEQVSGINCFTCHSPHESGDLSLRTTAAVELADGEIYDYNESNLCANCHKARRDPSSIGDDFNVSSTHWGPHHGPQADMLNGTIGYEFDDYDYINTNHANAIEKVCITCHMGNPQQHNGFGVGGHSFTIEDEEGNSIAGVCESCHSEAEDIDWLADADYDHDGSVEGYQSEIDGLIDSLAVLLLAQGVLGGDAVDGYHPNAGIVDSAGVAGALWNFIYIAIEDKSHGIHNFNYTQGLLQSSIDYVATQPVP
ncbi:hypothetical protein ACFLQG_00380 [Candidatus Zixiibacteriota bacterium]